MINNIFTATNTAKQLLHDHSIGRVSHAYMIIGPKGSGKKTLVNEFAKLLLCEHPDGNEPCGQCASCKYFNEFGEHPNYTRLSLDKKATIGVEEVREMSDGVYTAPYMSDKKVYVITDAEKMTTQAQNALLKILEEPPEYVAFFLLTSNRYAMLSTILSRCRVLNMGTYNEKAMLSIINERKPEATPEERAVLLHRASGLPGKLNSYLDAEDITREKSVNAVYALLSNDAEQILNSTNDIDTRESALKFTNSLQEIMRDAVVYMLEDNIDLTINPDEKDLLSVIKQNCSLKKVMGFLDETQTTIKMLSGNVSFQLCVKNLLMKW